MKKYEESRKRAKKKYEAKNKEATKYMQYKSRARSFVKNLATEKDLLLLNTEIEGVLKMKEFKLTENTTKEEIRELAAIEVKKVILETTGLCDEYTVEDNNTGRFLDDFTLDEAVDEYLDNLEFYNVENEVDPSDEYTVSYSIYSEESDKITSFGFEKSDIHVYAAFFEDKDFSVLNNEIEEGKLSMTELYYVVCNY